MLFWFMVVSGYVLTGKCILNLKSLSQIEYLLEIFFLIGVESVCTAF